MHVNRLDDVDPTLAAKLESKENDTHTQMVVQSQFAYGDTSLVFWLSLGRPPLRILTLRPTSLFYHGARSYHGIKPNSHPEVNLKSYWQIIPQA